MKVNGRDKKTAGSGGGGMPDSNVRWLVIQHAPLPCFVFGLDPSIFIMKHRNNHALFHQNRRKNYRALE